ASLLVEVHHHATAFGGDHAHRRMQLPTAVAPSRAEYVAGEALRVHSHQHVLPVLYLPADQRHVLGRVHIVAVAHDAELTERCRHARFGHPMHQAPVGQPVRHQPANRHERRPSPPAEPRGRVDRHGEGGFVRLGVVLGHLGEAQSLTPLGQEGQADQPARVRRHEIDHLGRDPLGRADQVSLVLSGFVVGHDHQLAGANVRDRLLYFAVLHSCLTYFPSTSPSTCTRSPTPSAPSVVCSRVNGISAICTLSFPGRSLMVRLTPSTVIAPRGIDTSRTASGTRRSYTHASSRRSTRCTTATPSTCPWTMSPPTRSAARSARSRFTGRPATYSPNNVRPSVVSTTCTENPPFSVRSTVRHAPYTAMLSPSLRSEEHTSELQ